MVARARQAARQIAKQRADELPVNVRAIAEELGVTVADVDLSDDVSAVLVTKDKQAIIGVNMAHHPNRQRFSIAHEIGHLLLHAQSAGTQTFIESTNVFFRDGRSSDGSELREIEANAFAAELLMPEHILRNELRSHRPDLFDEEAMKPLALKFGVSVQALNIRIARLGFTTLA
jgi:Zn-dependent peptidase ImmA (M78 family)